MGGRDETEGKESEVDVRDQEERRGEHGGMRGRGKRTCGRDEGRGKDRNWDTSSETDGEKEEGSDWLNTHKREEGIDTGK